MPIPALHTFLCVAGLSNDPTAGLFFRPSRPTDAPLGFFEALRKKYASNNESNNQAASDEEIRISGKTVEEVGFEKIRRQLANLQELQIVILDGLQIASREGTKPYHSTKDPDGVLSNSEAPWIHAHDLKIVELDLSRNLLETWADVAAICAPLRFLRFLKLKYV